ncbi:MAG: type 1 glutamine amidotransferase [Bradymonadaceae bacterium]
MSQRTLLLQARESDDPILDHEFECFVRRTGLESSSFHRVNADSGVPTPDILEEVDAVFVGGSGNFSVVERNFDWYDDVDRLMREAVERQKPLFGSCFGFQLLIDSFGGRLRRDPDQAEVGTFEIELTDSGARDPLFGEMPDRFDAQLGHEDSVVEMPSEFELLAQSDHCDVQAIRVPGAPVVATQFHPELTHEDNIRRFVRYIEKYKDIDESPEEARARADRLHRPSPESNALLELFIERHLD